MICQHVLTDTPAFGILSNTHSTILSVKTTAEKYFTTSLSNRLTAFSPYNSEHFLEKKCVEIYSANNQHNLMQLINSQSDWRVFEYGDPIQIQARLQLGKEVLCR